MGGSGTERASADAIADAQRLGLGRRWVNFRCRASGPTPRIGRQPAALSYSSRRAQFLEAGRREVAVESECASNPETPHRPEARCVNEGVGSLVVTTEPLQRFVFAVPRDEIDLDTLVNW